MTKKILGHCQRAISAKLSPLCQPPPHSPKDRRTPGGARPISHRKPLGLESQFSWKIANETKEGKDLTRSRIASIPFPVGAGPWPVGVTVRAEGDKKSMMAIPGDALGSVLNVLV